MWMLSMYSKVTWLKVVGDTKRVKTNFCNSGPGDSNMRKSLFCAKYGKGKGSLQPLSVARILRPPHPWQTWSFSESQLWLKGLQTALLSPLTSHRGQGHDHPTVFLSLLHCGSNWYQSPHPHQHLLSIDFLVFLVLLIIWLESDGLSDSNTVQHREL